VSATYSAPAEWKRCPCTITCGNDSGCVKLSTEKNGRWGGSEEHSEPPTGDRRGTLPLLNGKNPRNFE
jgi:hypothetical protein